jgi:putative transposase
VTSYQRNFVLGDCQFFTVNLADRKSRLLIDHFDGLRAAFRYAHSRHPFAIDWGGDIAEDTVKSGER